MKVKKKIVYLAYQQMFYRTYKYNSKGKKIWGTDGRTSNRQSHFREEENSSIDLGTKIQNTTQLNGVSKVIPQHEWDYSNNIKKLRPNFLFTEMTEIYKKL